MDPGAEAVEVEVDLAMDPIRYSKLPAVWMWVLWSIPNLPIHKW